jgi:hypothetical protein
VPAKLVEKTRRELDELRLHWQLPDLLRVMSYELLGQPQSGAVLDTDGRVVTPDALERFAPDLIVADECHRLKRRSAAVTKRVHRYLKRHPDCRLAAMTGTPITHSLLDCGHLIVRALGRGAPLPLGASQLEDWAQALDKDDVDVGALTALGGTDKDSVRRAFRDRLVSTPGVVVYDRPYRGVGLSIDPLPLSPPPVVMVALELLRDRWELPDGSKLVEALELWRAVRQLALGFYYRWSPTPPRHWLDARSEWSAVCRHIVGANRRNLDSPKPVIDAVDAGLYPEAIEPLACWRAVRDSYEPTTVAYWLHPYAAEAAAAWLEEAGIVWTEHDAFATRVSELSGAPYFAAEGRDRFGTHIMDASGPVVASAHSCAEGLNLQGTWSRNLITSLPGSKLIEQLIGRTHREGQSRDVSVEWFRCCPEHDDAYGKALNKARFVEATTGLEQKLIGAI